MNDICGIWEKFETDKNLVKEYKYWVVVIRKNQATLGSCVAITREHHEKIGDLSAEEMAEYQTVAKDVESALKSVFDYDYFYHLASMKKDKHTHFHLFPRYEREISFAGELWVDNVDEVPAGRKNVKEQETLDQIKAKIKHEIGK